MSSLFPTCTGVYKAAMESYLWRDSISRVFKIANVPLFVVYCHFTMMFSFAGCVIESAIGRLGIVLHGLAVFIIHSGNGVIMLYISGTTSLAVDCFILSRSAMLIGTKDTAAFLKSE